MSIYLTSHFTREEMACSHCGEVTIKRVGLARLERVRAWFGRPMPITSGCRCPDHPAESGKPLGPGPHTVYSGSGIPDDYLCVDVLVHAAAAMELYEASARTASSASDFTSGGRISCDSCTRTATQATTIGLGRTGGLTDAAA